MANLYLDKAGLQILLTKLNAKYEGMFLGLHAEADVAKKVANKLTLNIDGVANEFDGSGAKSLDVAAAIHTHKAADISDFKTEVRKEIFGATAGDGTVDIHKHTNLNELELIAAGDVSKWNAKIGTADVAKLAYQNDGMSGVLDVKGALDVLVKNMQMVVNEDIANKTNMITIKAAIDKEVQDRTNADAALQQAITALENANKEGGTVANAIAAVEGKADAAQQQADKGVADAAKAQAAADKAQGEVDALEGVVGALDTAYKAADVTLQANIDAKVAQSAYDTKMQALDKKDEDLQAAIEAEAGRAAGVEAGLDAAVKAAQADADALEKRLDDEGGLVDRIEANEAFVAAQPAIDAEQDRRLGVLEAKFTGDASVDAKIAAAQAAAEAEAARLDGVLKAELQKEIDDDVKVVADDLAEEVLRAKAAEEAALAAAQAAQADIDAFMNANAVKEGTIDTLKEIQLYIEEHGQEAAGMVQDIADNKKAIEDEAARADAAEKANAQAIATEKSRAEGQEAAIRGEFAAADTALEAAVKKYADDAVAAEKGLREAADTQIRTDYAAADEAVAAAAAQDAANKVAAEKSAREAAELALSNRIAAFEGEGEGSVKAQVEAVQDALDAFEEAQATKEQAQDKAIEDAQAAADKAQEEVDAVEQDLAKEAEDRAAADDALAAKIGTVAADTNLAAMIKAVQDDVDQNEADCDAAIKAEQERAEKAEADNEGRIVVLEGDMTQAKADIEANAQAISANTQALAAIGVPMKEEDIQSVIDLVFQ